MRSRTPLRFRLAFATARIAFRPKTNAVANGQNGDVGPRTTVGVTKETSAEVCGRCSHGVRPPTPDSRVSRGDRRVDSGEALYNHLQNWMLGLEFICWYAGFRSGIH
jgi:hypothetical protein